MATMRQHVAIANGHAARPRSSPHCSNCASAASSPSAHATVAPAAVISAMVSDCVGVSLLPFAFSSGDVLPKLSGGRRGHHQYESGNSQYKGLHARTPTGMRPCPYVLTRRTTRFFFLTCASWDNQP